MTQKRANISNSEWNEHLARKTIEIRAAQRAQHTHRERRAREFAERKAREDAQIDKSKEFAYTRRQRAAELEKERIDRNRRGINPDIERMALAKFRRDEAGRARDASLSTIETNRPDAVITGAYLAAETRREHAAEVASANSTTSAEYRAAIEVRVDAVTRLREYRAERAMETSKIELERRTAVALMAYEASATRLLREMGEDSTPVLAAESSRPKLRALAALMSEIAKSSDTENTDDSAKPQPVKRSPEKSEELIDELRCNMAKSREEADDVKSNTGKQPIPQDAGRNSPRRIDRGDSLPFRRDPL